jgi:hypothetical protein
MILSHLPTIGSFLCRSADGSAAQHLPAALVPPRLAAHCALVGPTSLGHCTRQLSPSLIPKNGPIPQSVHTVMLAKPLCYTPVFKKRSQVKPPRTHTANHSIHH